MKAVLTSLLLALLAGPLQAALTFTYVGEITKATGSSLPAGIDVGDSFTIQWIFDELAIDEHSGGFPSDFKSEGSPFGIRVVIDGTAFSMVGTQIELKDDHTYEVQGLDEMTPLQLGDLGVDELDLDLEFANGFFADETLPLTAFNFSDFVDTFLEIQDDGDYLIEGFLTGGGPTTPIPEPATLTLFGIGAAGLAATKFKSRKKKSA